MYSRALIVYFILLLGYLTSVTAHATPQQNANSLIAGILSYTNWIPQPDHINFCIIDGPTRFINSQFFNPLSPLIRPNQVKVIELKSNEILQNPMTLHSTMCHVLYFVNTLDKVQQQIINHQVSPALSISEYNAECAIGSAFCLYRTTYRYDFKVNLSSLKKSNIRVNSKVLMLADSEGYSK